MAVTSSEFLVNMKKSDIPPWNDLLPFEDQPLSTQQFWENEADKVMNGVTINGYFIHPLLYWHLNIWQVPKDIPGSGGNRSIDRITGNPDLRDNDLMFIEHFSEAQKRGLHLMMFGTRRFGKALLDNEYVYTKYGPKKIGYAMYGDMIYDDSGNLTMIKGVYPQGRVQTYKITFEDGRKIVCCGEHQWRVKHGLNGGYSTKNVIGLLGGNDWYIQVAGCVNYPRKMLPLNPSTYGSLLANYLMGKCDSYMLSDRSNSEYIMSAPFQKMEFIKSFIQTCIGIETGHDEIKLKVENRKAIHFVKQMFWSTGYFCKYENGTLICSNTKKEIGIASIEMAGKASCTCIEVSNESHLFLTTNHIVTHNTVLISSYSSYYATTRYNSTNSIIGGSKGDLEEIIKYLDLGLEHVPPFFRMSRISSDWEKGIVFGSKTNNNIRNTWSYLDVINVDMGKKSSTQKTAGATPSSAVFDEIGKFSFLGAYQAALPSYSTPYGLRLTAILAGTSGEIEKCEDAQKVLSNPLSYSILPMNWDALDKMAGDHVTWKRQSWSLFVPGQMSHSEYCPKKETTLGKYLGKKDAKKLNKIKFLETDWENSTKNLKREREELSKGDKKRFVNFKMYYPFDPDDCFLNSGVNRYPVELAIIHKRHLEGEGQKGMLVDLWLNSDNTVGWKASEKMLAGYPFKGGVCDAPVQIFEFPDKSYGPGDYVYTAGMDPYKKDKSESSSSLGTLYIYKRPVRLNDSFGGTIVASYAARPANMDYFCETCECLLRMYNCKCLMENADIMFETYLKKRHIAELFLEYGDEVVNPYVGGSRSTSRSFGLSPTPKNQSILESVGVRYTWENVLTESDSNNLRRIETISDVWLLTEYILYKPGANVDRMVGFHHALLLADYYDYMKFFPKSEAQKELERQKMEKMKERYKNRSFVKVRRVFK